MKVDTSQIITGTLGVGITLPTSGAALQVDPLYYNTGTASQSGTTITGSGTSWSSNMVGKLFVFANGTQRLITAYTSTTSITADTSGTVSSQAYSVYYQGLLVDGFGNVAIGAGSVPTGGLLYVHNGLNGANIDVRGGNGTFIDQATIELEGNDYDSTTKSVYLQFRGSNTTGTTMGVSNANLGILQFGGDGAIITTVGNIPIVFGVDATATVQLTTSVLSPSTSDGVALGSTSLMWSDLFLASGGVLNFNNGNMAVTHSSGVLTVSGGNLALGTNSLTLTGSIASSGSRCTKGWFTDLDVTNTNTFLNTLLPTQTGNSGKFLTTNGTSSSWAATSGISRVVTVTSGNYTAGSAASTDYVYLINGAHTTTLPAAASNSDRYTFKNITGSTVTINRAGSDTIEGATSLSLGASESIDLISDGTSAWYVL